MKKFLCFILVFMLFIVHVPANVLADTPNATSHTVLVLDRSDKDYFYDNNKNLIYTADTAIDYVKASAKVFIKQLLNASPNNYIAIVSFQTLAYLETDFTNDYNKLISEIDNLYAAGSDRSIAEGLSEAQRAIDSVSGYNTQKNVVLFTTGMTDYGDHINNGKYSSSVVGSNWVNMNTNIKLYAYANAALSVAAKLKQTADIYTLGLFQTTENMPAYGKNVVSLFKRTTKDLASSEKHFHEVDDPNKLEFAFTSIAGNIIIPLSLDLYDKVTADTVSPAHYEGQVPPKYDRYQYKVTAYVHNNSPRTAKNVVCRINLPPEAYPLNEMISVSEQQTKSIGDIEPGKYKEAIWFLEFPWPNNEITTTYSISAKADNSIEIEKVDNIFIESKKIKDNSFIMGVDQWSFSNTNEYFGPKEEGYFLTSSDRELLFRTISNTEKDYISDFLDNEWGGSCFGMSAVAVLTKMGVYNAKDIQPPKTTLYEVSKKNNDSLESWLNFHQALTKSSKINLHKSSFVSKPISEKLTIIENLAKEVKTGGAPFVISLDVAAGGHAVVGYGHETGSWTIGPWLNKYTYTNRILIYDPNAPDETDDVYLYYDIKTGEFAIPKYTYVLNEIQGAMDIQLIAGMYDYRNAITNRYNYITTQKLTNYSILLGDSTYKIMPNMNDPETGFVTFFHDNGPGNEAPMVLAIPASYGSFTIDTGGKKDFSIHSSFNNYASTITADKAGKITFDENGNLQADGLKGEYTVDVVANEGYYNTPWYSTSVSGSKANTISLTSTADGVKVDGDNLSDITVSTFNDSAEDFTAVTTAETALLVTADADANPAVCYDADKDGTYETQIETYTITVATTEGGKTSFSEMQCSEGVKLELNATTDDGYGFSRWSSSEVALPWTKYYKNTSFTMPAHDVFISAEFTPVNSLWNKIWFGIKNMIGAIINIF